MKIRELFYHLRNEKALAARPRLYRKLLDHYNQESGYKIRSYEDFVRYIPVMYHLYSIVGKAATNVIVSMSASRYHHSNSLTISNLCYYCTINYLLTTE